MKSPLDQCCCGLIFLLLDGHRMEKESDMNNIGGSSRYEFTSDFHLPLLTVTVNASSFKTIFGLQ